MLCELAHNFPRLIANLLERDRHLKRNFREETVTDLLMASLVGLESCGIQVNLPDEPTTGGDMDWIYAAPLEIKGGQYLRLILQAKRAQCAERKKGNYWFYQHLDHGVPAGQQVKTLIQYAATSPDGMPTLPLYMFYHPASALRPAVGSKPAVEGINIVFASTVANIVKGRCGLKEKRVAYWQDNFLPLSDLLCWPVIVEPAAMPPPSNATEFLLGPGTGFLYPLSGAFHPDLVARRLQGRRDQSRARIAPDEPEPPPIVPTDGIPDDIRRAIDGKMTGEDRERLKRPRVIFTTRMTRDSPSFLTAAKARRSGPRLG